METTVAPYKAREMVPRTVDWARGVRDRVDAVDIAQIAQNKRSSVRPPICRTSSMLTSSAPVAYSPFHAMALPSSCTYAPLTASTLFRSAGNGRRCWNALERVIRDREERRLFMWWDVSRCIRD
jgi:hypothetical protein